MVSAVMDIFNILPQDLGFDPWPLKYFFSAKNHSPSHPPKLINEHQHLLEANLQQIRPDTLLLSLGRYGIATKC